MEENGCPTKQATQNMETLTSYVSGYQYVNLRATIVCRTYNQETSGSHEAHKNRAMNMLGPDTTDERHSITYMHSVSLATTSNTIGKHCTCVKRAQLSANHRVHHEIQNFQSKLIYFLKYETKCYCDSI